MIAPVKRFLQNFFGLSRAETNGFLIFLPLLVLIIFSEPISAWWIDDEPTVSATDKIVLDSLAAIWSVKKSADIQTEHGSEKSEIRFFAFNPNNVTEAEMKLLGFSSATASRIVHYRAKNGEFHVKSDLMKIYGMDPLLYAKLRTYIDLPDKVEIPSWHNATAQNKLAKKDATNEKIKFDLNTADTTELKRIYGIGVKLSGRIVRYRQKLGGFVTMEQVKEVYGLDSAVINRLKEHAFIAEGFVPTRISINQATESELGSHPYLTKGAAKAIATYRFHHGNFTEVNDLRVLHVLSDETISKIGPYLKFDD